MCHSRGAIKAINSHAVRQITRRFTFGHRMAFDNEKYTQKKFKNIISFDFWCSFYCCISGKTNREQHYFDVDTYKFVVSHRISQSAADISDRVRSAYVQMMATKTAERSNDSQGIKPKMCACVMQCVALVLASAPQSIYTWSTERTRAYAIQHIHFCHSCCTHRYIAKHIGGEEESASKKRAEIIERQGIADRRQTHRHAKIT